jgi:pyridoxal phosphate enzyme (YggS family)
MRLDLGAAGRSAPTTIPERLTMLRKELEGVARAAGREPSEIAILGVTKTQPREAVLEAIAAGLQDIGENYVQEAREKYRDLPPVRKHFIGHVQTNKAKAIVAGFDVVQSVDRIEAGRALAKAMRTLGKRLKVLVQVNISPAERFGVAPEGAAALAAALRDEGLDVDGVMAIGPITEDRAQLAAAFERAREAFAAIGGSILSLGMSADWREAVAHGSTMIRIGTAIFGPRHSAEGTHP